MSNIIEASSLVKRYGDLTALDGLDLAVPEGSILGLLGPNGAGKTTAVSILTTLIKPDSGSATVAGADVVGEPKEVRKRIGLSGQYAAVDEHLTGFENLDMIGRLYRLGRRRARERARELLERFDLADAAERPVKTYSGGMRRRLDLAGALVAEVPVLFLDEPTTGLDPVSRARVWEEVRALNEQLGMTILLTTQHLEEADSLAHRVGIIDDGRLVVEGTPDDLKRRVGSDLVIVRIDGRANDAEAAVATLDGVDVVDRNTGELVLATTDGAATIGPVAVALSNAGVHVRDLTLRTPTLDDVFLEMTGNRLDDEGQQAQEQPSHEHHDHRDLEGAAR
jgi:ABC-2 type transport system ATP-binding protein